jgi:hypothetical protein
MTSSEVPLEATTDALKTVDDARFGSRPACARDVLYLDLALEAAGRTLVEARMADVKAWAAVEGGAYTGNMGALLRLLAAALENACLALGSNQELALCYKDLWVCVRPSAHAFLLPAMPFAGRYIATCDEQSA